MTNAALTAFVQEQWPLLQRAIDAAAPEPLSVDVHWHLLQFDCEPHHYDEYWTKLYFAPLERALLDVGRDEVTRAALGRVLKQVVVTNSGAHTTSRSWCSFAHGVVTLDHALANVDDVDERAQTLVRLLERAADEAQNSK